MNDQPIDPRIHARTDVIVPDATRAAKALVCGAGMVGSWTTAALARMLSHVDVVDFDTVEHVNLGVQLYDFSDIDTNKATATVKHLSGFKVTGWPESVEAVISDLGITEWQVVVSAVDSMEVRKYLAKTCREARVPLFIDVRVLGEMVCILTARNDDEYGAYLQTILPDDQVETAPCGSEGTVYSGLFAASRVAAVVNNVGRGAFVRQKEVWNVSLVELLDEGMNEGGSLASEGSSQEEAVKHRVQRQSDGPQGHTADYTRQQVEYEAEGIHRSTERNEIGQGDGLPAGEAV